jgi:hypothetical protein
MMTKQIYHFWALASAWACLSPPQTPSIIYRVVVGWHMPRLAPSAETEVFFTHGNNKERPTQKVISIARYLAPLQQFASFFHIRDQDGENRMVLFI